MMQVKREQAQYKRFAVAAFAVFLWVGALWGAFPVHPDEDETPGEGKRTFIEEIEHEKDIGRIQSPVKRPIRKIKNSLLARAVPVGAPGVAGSENAGAEHSKKAKPVKADKQDGSGKPWQLVFFLCSVAAAGFVLWFYRSRSGD